MVWKKSQIPITANKYTIFFQLYHRKFTFFGYNKGISKKRILRNIVKRVVENERECAEKT